MLFIMKNDQWTFCNVCVLKVTLDVSSNCLQHRAVQCYLITERTENSSSQQFADGPCLDLTFYQNYLISKLFLCPSLIAKFGRLRMTIRIISKSLPHRWQVQMVVGSLDDDHGGSVVEGDGDDLLISGWDNYSNAGGWYYCLITMWVAIQSHCDQHTEYY